MESGLGQKKEVDIDVTEKNVSILVFMESGLGLVSLHFYISQYVEFQSLFLWKVDWDNTCPLFSNSMLVSAFFQVSYFCRIYRVK